MRYFQLAFVLVLTSMVPLVSSQARASGELDHESQVTNVDKKTAAATLPGTLVVRINNVDHTRAVFVSHQVLSADESSQQIVNGASFTPVSPTKKLQASELDHDSSTDSWWFGWGGGWGGGWGWPTFYNYGYSYPYYQYYGYNYYPYSYSYYWNPYFYY